MMASGATVLCFTTGRGTPLGFPVPTIKVSSNSRDRARRSRTGSTSTPARCSTARRRWTQLEDDLFALILDVASGKQLANNEKNGYREIAIWKEGVTL